MVKANPKEIRNYLAELAVTRVLTVPEIITNYLGEIVNINNNMPMTQIVKVVEVIQEARQMEKGVYIFGNGGSAATASHFATDLAKGTIADARCRIRAMALTDNIALFSAWANDTSYEYVFAEQMENLVQPGDVVIGISGSGNSENVIEGIKLAGIRGATTVALTGFNGGRIRDLADIVIVVPSHNLQQVEDIHLMLCHIITTCLIQRG